MLQVYCIIDIEEGIGRCQEGNVEVVYRNWDMQYFKRV